MRRPVVGVLALQGCVERHRPHLEACGAAMRAVRCAEELLAVDGIILPGGESTAMLRLIDVYGLEPALRQACRERPVWGICAGAILIAREHLSLMDYSVTRNGYGRQLESRRAEVAGYPVAFIRAPRIREADPSVEVVARLEGEPVWLASGSRMATTFHPELTLEPPSPMHRAFVELVSRPAPKAGGYGSRHSRCPSNT
jgi:5'-phosphate synthase pdxT subunit